jgi:serine/threonine-protein kinase
MEYLDGVNLQVELRRRAASDPYTPAEVIALLQPLAQALDYAHNLGIIHRDLKPANIILTPNGPVITDFGLAKLLMEEAATVSVVMGTPSYMAPEQIQAEPVDARSDVYALGIILYELLCGRVPFTGPTPFAIAQAHIAEPIPSLADLDPRWAHAPLLNDVARRAIAKRKADRWTSAGAMVAALERAFDMPLDIPSRPTVSVRPAKSDVTR